MRLPWEIQMKENVQELEEITVRPKTDKEALLNPMAVAGGRFPCRIR
jgi:hypothetical protein